MAYFVSSGILGLLRCGFLTSPCFKIPRRTPRRNVRPGGDSRRRVPCSAHGGPLGGFAAFPNPVPCHCCQPEVLSQGDFDPPWILTESEDIWGYHHLEMLLVSTGWRPGTKPNIPQYTGQPSYPQTEASLSTSARCWGQTLGWTRCYLLARQEKKQSDRPLRPIPSSSHTNPRTKNGVGDHDGSSVPQQLAFRGTRLPKCETSMSYFPETL